MPVSSSPDLSHLSPNENIAMPTVVASNVPPAATVPPNDPTVASMAPVFVQAPLIDPAAAPAKTGPETVTACRNASVFGRVISSKAIQMQGFTCFGDANSSAASAPGSHDIALGSCPLASTTSAHKPDCKWDVALNVHLADAADAGKMQTGKLVRLGGDFHLVRRDAADYLVVDKAKILFLDNFWTASRRWRGYRAILQSSLWRRLQWRPRPQHQSERFQSVWSVRSPFLMARQQKRIATLFVIAAVALGPLAVVQPAVAQPNTLPRWRPTRFPACRWKA